MYAMPATGIASAGIASAGIASAALSKTVPQFHQVFILSIRLCHL